eukprot:1160538-Pelagomonas_calceolata.AAC.6
MHARAVISCTEECNHTINQRTHRQSSHAHKDAIKQSTNAHKDTPAQWLAPVHATTLPRKHERESGRLMCKDRPPGPIWLRGGVSALCHASGKCVLCAEQAENANSAPHKQRGKGAQLI